MLENLATERRNKKTENLDELSTKERTAVVAMNFKDIPAADVADVLSEQYNIAIRPGAHCAPLMHEALGTKDQGIVRFSFSSMNTEEEVDYAINAIKSIAKEL